MKVDRRPSDASRALADVTMQIEALQDMTAGELAELGIVRSSESPHARATRAIYKKKIAWRIQELAEGGLSERTLERIESLADEAPARWRRARGRPARECRKPLPQTPRDPRLPAPGTVLTRDHQGTRHDVTVLDSGFEYRGQRFTSLSRIARAITGTQWNGFLFFGLRHPGSKTSDKGET